MANVNTNLTESVIRQIMEGTDPRVAIDTALDEKAGFHKEKRIRDGKAEIVNVKNRKKKRTKALTAGQKKAIRKAHSAAANRKRGKSLKRGAKMGLYKEGIDLEAQVLEAEEEVDVTVEEPVEAPAEEAPAEEAACLVIPCAKCEAALEIFDDPDTDDEGIILVCPECGAVYTVDEVDEDDDDDDDDKDEENAEEPAAEEAAAEEEVPTDESVEISEGCEGGDCEDECDPVDPDCDGQECGEPSPEVAEEVAPEEESGLFFAVE